MSSRSWSPGAGRVLSLMTVRLHRCVALLYWAVNRRRVTLSEPAGVLHIILELPPCCGTPLE